jgi:hypothetical protein
VITLINEAKQNIGLPNNPPAIRHGIICWKIVDLIQAFKVKSVGEKLIIG